MESPKTILIVDDDKGIVDLFKNILEPDGYAFKTAYNGIDALEIINTSHIDVVLSDIHMPGLSGVELLRAVKSKHKGLPIIMISGMATAITRDKVVKMGSLMFMEKPVSFELLRKTVKDAISGELQKQIARRILVVDDHEPTRNMLNEVLTSANYVAVLASNGREALEKIKSAEKPFDYAMIDIHMPEMNGIEFIGECRNTCPATLPIIMTGEADTDEIREAYKKGGFTLIKKPFDIPTLLFCVAQLQYESDSLKEETARKAALKKLPFYKKAYINLRDNVIFAPSSSRAKKFLRAAGVVIVFAAIGVALIASAISFEKWINQGHSQIESVIDKVVGYLERDEQRELQKIREISNWLDFH